VALAYCWVLLAGDKQIDSFSPLVLRGRKSTGAKRLGGRDSCDPKQMRGSARLQFSKDFRKILFNSIMVLKKTSYSLQYFVK